MKLRVLGAHGGLVQRVRPVCYRLGRDVLLDAGAATTSLPLDDQYDIDHIFLSGCQLDHILTLGFLADNVIGFRKGPVNVYGSGPMMDRIYADFYNNRVWPDFTKIPTPDNPVVTFHRLTPGRSVSLGGIEAELMTADGEGHAATYLFRGAFGSLAYGELPDSGDKVWGRIAQSRDLRALLVNLPPHGARDYIRGVRGGVTKSLAGRAVPLLLGHLRPGEAAELRLRLNEALAGSSFRFLSEGDELDLRDPLAVPGADLTRVHLQAPAGVESKPDQEMVIDAQNAARQRQMFERFGRTYKAGEAIFSEGSAGQEMYIVQEGQVKLIKAIAGERRTIETVSAGEFFGEMAVLNRRPRSLTAVAVTDVKLLIFPAETFASLVVSNAGLATRIIRTLAGRLQNADNHIENLLYHDAESKLVNVLLKQIDDNGIRERGGYKLKLNPTEVSELVSLPRETVKEVMGRLAKSGIVEIQKQALFIPSLEKLEKTLSLLSLQAELGFSGGGV